MKAIRMQELSKPWLLRRMARLWDTATGKPIRDFLGHKSSVLCAFFSHDGTRLVTADADGMLFVWDPISGDSIAQMPAHRGRCFGLSMSPDGSLIATASRDRTAKIWDLGRKDVFELKHPNRRD